ncbi:MAG: DnaA family protein [Paraglaciecola sp.]|jgi:DnaA family protein
MSKQLSLAVNLRDTETFDSFVMGDNSQLVSHLHSLIEPLAEVNKQGWLTFISAESGVGKSHLLYALCQHAQQHGVSSVYLNCHDIEALSVEMLESLEHCQLICLDDIDGLNGSNSWQVAVFDLINRVQEQGTAKLVITANTQATHLSFKLADLVSRLSWGLSFKLYGLNDEQRCDALLNRASQRGLKMPINVANYLVNHWQRDMPALMNTLDKLDELSLQQQRKLTIPFVKASLGL